jgi:hypothetical protein
MKGSLTDHIPSLKESGGGRTILLFLLFILSIYTMITSGMVAWGAIMMVPLFIIVGIILVSERDYIFFLLLFVNYFISAFAREGYIPIPYILIK